MFVDDGQPNYLLSQQATPSFTFTTKSLGSSRPPHTLAHHEEEVPTSLYRTSGSRAAASEGREPSAAQRGTSEMVFDSDRIPDRHASFSERFSSVLSAPLPASLQTRTGALPVHHLQQQTARASSSSVVNARSTTPSRAKPQSVHDSLYEQGRMYRAMREELQAKAVKEEMKGVTGTPTVSRYANERALERQRRLGRKENILDRMEAATQASKHKLEKKRQEMLERRRRQQEEEEFGITAAASDDDDSLFGEMKASEHGGSKGPSRRMSSITKRPPSKDGSRKGILRAVLGNRQPTPRTLSFSPGAKSRSASAVSGGGAAGSQRAASSNAPPRNASARRRTRTPFQPRLTEKGRTAEAKVTAPDYLSQHQHRAQQRADAYRTDTMLKELQHCRDVPEISMRSRELTQRMAEREGLAGMSYIEAMMERDRKNKAALAEKAERLRIEENLFQPRITAYAAMLGSGHESSAPSAVMRASQPTHAERSRMEVAERLYADSFAIEERRAERARRIDAERGATNKPNIPTNGSSRAPSANTSVAGRESVGDRLLRQHEEAMRERQRRIAEKEQLAKLTARPAIDPVSAAITARLPETAQERLLSGLRSHSVADTPMGARESGDNGAPRRVLSSEEENRMLHKLQSYDERRREKLRQLQMEREEEELAECTFRPSTTNTYYVGEDGTAPTQDVEGRNQTYFTHFNDVEAAPEPGVVGDQENREPPRPQHQQPTTKQPSWRETNIVERNEVWAAQRAARLAAQRDELKEREVEGCTFKPDVPRKAPVERPSHSDPHRSLSAARSGSAGGTIYGGDGTPWGVNEYLARQQYARYLQLERECKLAGRRPPPPFAFDPSAAPGHVDSMVSSSTEGTRDVSPQPRGASTATGRQPSTSQQPGSSGSIASLRPPSGPGDVRGLLDISKDDGWGVEEPPVYSRRGPSLLVPPTMM